MLPRVLNTLASKVEGEDLFQTELEWTSWWKWGKPPEHRIKSLWLITIVYVEYGHRTRGGKSYVEGVYMLKTSFEKTEKDFTNDLEKLLKKYGFK